MTGGSAQILQRYTEFTFPVMVLGVVSNDGHVVPTSLLSVGTQGQCHCRVGTRHNDQQVSTNADKSSKQLKVPNFCKTLERHFLNFIKKFRSE